MAGLNFQTQTIINSNLDPNSNNAVLFSADEDKKVLNIKRDFHFYADKAGVGKVCAIRKRAGYEAKMCQATIDFSKFISEIKPSAGKTYCRLDLYLGIEGNHSLIYAIQSPNEVLKGIPFWIEFTVKSTDTAKTIAENVAKAIKSNHIFQCDKDLINVDNSQDGKLVLTGATEYQRFKKIEISKFAATDDYADTVVVLGDEGIALNERGANSFGTFSQIVKDLRPLTAANYQPYHIRQVETPEIGAIYNQYIIEYVGPAVNDGFQFVGQRGETNTVHVFWVKQDVDLIGDWEDALSVIGDIEDVDAPAATEGDTTLGD